VSTASRLILNLTAALITLGGLYDVLTPRLPPNHVERCQGNARALELVRALLRALGGCLIAVGIAVLILVNAPASREEMWALWAAFLLVALAEGLNAWGMYKVGSPFYFPLAFVMLAAVGVTLGLVARAG
jgi:hypothetical protein